MFHVNGNDQVLSRQREFHPEPFTRPLSGYSDASPKVWTLMLKHYFGFPPLPRQLSQNLPNGSTFGPIPLYNPWKRAMIVYII